MTTDSTVLGAETLEPGEEAAVETIIQQNIDSMDADADPAQRAQHPKHHGCFKARFTVRKDLPKHLQHGAFQPSAAYDAWVRFSNGKSADDSEKDAHGMAIKLLGVGLDPLEPTDPGGGTMDIVLIDSPIFFSKDLEEYVVFNQHFGAILDAERNEDSIILRVAEKIQQGVRMAFKDFGMVMRAQKFADQTAASPLATDYWSTVPYRLGPDTQAVKYMARTERAMEPGAQDGVESEDGLGASLRADLVAGKAEFEFGVHVQTRPATHSVEDPTMPWWDEDDGHGGRDAMIPIGRITIDQGTQSDDEKAENLAFSPWNAADVHKPLGVVNRLRRAVYRRLAEERHRRNGLG